MNNLRIGRHIREGFKHLARNRWMTVISLISVVVTLLIVGVFTLLLMNVNHMTKGLEDNVEAVVYIDTNSTVEQRSVLEQEIRSMEEVDKVVFISKDEGLNNLIKDLGEQGKAFESLKKDNPLNDTFEVNMKDPQDTEKVSKRIANLTHVEKVDFGEKIVKTLFKFTQIARTFGLSLIIGLVLTALLLIANTIKLTIEMRKNEIKIMRLVGATNIFIRTPFVIEGAILGIVGAIIPIIIMYFGYSETYKAYQKAITINFAKLLPMSEVFPTVAALLLGLSILIGMIGSAISISKYLKV